MRLVIRGLKGFEWDRGNWRKSELNHGVAAAEAQEVLLNEPLCQIDEKHSQDKQRFVGLGQTTGRRHLFVAFTMRQNRVRIISSRPMSRKERVIYEEARAKEKSRD